MAINGIGSGVGLNILPTRQDLAPAAERNNIGRTTENSTGTAASGRDGGTDVVNTGARFDPPPASNQLNPNSQDRRDPADIEALRNQFGLQSENSQAPQNTAVSNFIAVAQFEERDEIATATGIDIFV